jgi:hypothetical protein
VFDYTPRRDAAGWSEGKTARPTAAPAGPRGPKAVHKRTLAENAVQALKGEGCAAGGKRLAAIDEGDYPMCQRSLYGPWRMITVYRPPPDESIVIVSVARHTDRENPNATLAEIFPGLSAVGRRRSDQPPCCDDPQTPPALSAEADNYAARALRPLAVPAWCISRDPLSGSRPASRTGTATGKPTLAPGRPTKPRRRGAGDASTRRGSYADVGSSKASDCAEPLNVETLQ